MPYKLAQTRVEYGARLLSAPLNLLLFSYLLGASGCDKKEMGAACDLNAQGSDSMCMEGEVCEPVQGGQPKCFPPVMIQGTVFALSTSSPIPDARVIAIDGNGSAASSVAVSGLDGGYTLRIPSLRNMDGSVISADYTLRADAASYQSFPGGIRPALPIKLMGATPTGGLVLNNALTAIGLVGLPAAPRGIIAGSVQAGTGMNSGILIAGGGVTAISDRDGSFVLFNVTPGDVVVRGYGAGVQLNSQNVSLTAGARVDGVVLSAANTPLSTVSGSIQLVNASNVAATSVVLALEETFNTSLERGEVPRGLRAGNLTTANSSFTIANVPDGKYVVMAAFENDNAVRDPDPNIAGTQLVHIAVPAVGGSRAVQLPTSFKVTGALDVRSPGKDQPDPVSSATPTFVWARDSSADGYELRVFDSLGTLLWNNPNVPKVTAGDVSVQYAGPALTPGVYYQFRATSMKAGAPISRTEDLRGVFYLPKP